MHVSEDACDWTRTTGGSFSGFAVTRAEPDEKASANAAEELAEMLETDCDVVPCPQCGALTFEMQRAKRTEPFLCFG